MNAPDIYAKPRKAAPDWLARNVDDEAVAAWLAVDRLSTAEPHELRQCRRAIYEMQDRINRMVKAL